MLMENAKGMVGYSWGFGLRISKFHLSYANSIYHVAGRTNHFTISTNLGDWYNLMKKKKPEPVKINPGTGS